MDPAIRKSTLRMIPYGLYVLTGAGPDGQLAAATVNWVTQASFEPPLVAVGVKADSTTHAVIKASRAFALNVLGKDQGAVAYAFFKPVTRDGDTINGSAFRAGTTGAPILAAVPAWIECELEEIVERGDHSLFLGRVVAVGAAEAPAGRPDDLTLTLRDLGEKVFYGG